MSSTLPSHLAEAIDSAVTTDGRHLIEVSSVVADLDSIHNHCPTSREISQLHISHIYVSHV